jgi:hypothetical protein
MAKRIIFYTAKDSGCKPCEEMGKLIEAGKFQSPDGEVDFVDIMTDEGFQQFNDQILSKQDGAVPSAYLDGKQCKITVENRGEEKIVYFECPNIDRTSSPDGKSSQLVEAGEHDAAPSGPPGEPLSVPQ